MGQGGGPQPGHQSIQGNVIPGQIGFHEHVVVLAGRFHELFPPGRGQGGFVFGQRPAFDGLALGLLVEIQPLQGEQVDEPGELLALPDRDGHGHGMGAELVAHGGQRPFEIRSQPVHLVDAGELGHAVGHGLAPDRLGLGLHPGHGAKNADRAVQDPKRSFHLDGEIHMTRGVDDIDLMVAPGTRGASRGNGDAAFLFLGHEIHGGRAFVHFAHAVDLAGVIENAFGQRGLAGVDVGNDTDIAQAGQPVLSASLLGAHDGSAVVGLGKMGATGRGPGPASAGDEKPLGRVAATATRSPAPARG